MSTPPSPPPTPSPTIGSSSSVAPATQPSVVFGTKDFSTEEKTNIRNLLQQRLGKEHLATRQGAGGAQFTYVESWQTIQIANSIFGFNGWSSSVVDLSPDFVEERQGKFVVGVTAVVKVTLKDGTSHEDVGYGLAENPRKGIAIENAKKEAVTDARKRALRLFGNALGNCIYDKSHLKRIKTTQTANAQGFLPVDTTMDLMNKATPSDGEKASYNAPPQPIYNGKVETRQPTSYVAPQQIKIPLKQYNPNQQQPQQQYQPQQQQQQQQLDLFQDGWAGDEADLEALMNQHEMNNGFGVAQQQSPPNSSLVGQKRRL